MLKRRGYNPADLDPWYFPSAEEYKSVSALSFLGSHLLRRLSWSPVSYSSLNQRDFPFRKLLYTLVWPLFPGLYLIGCASFVAVLFLLTSRMKKQIIFFGKCRNLVKRIVKMRRVVGISCMSVWDLRLLSKFELRYCLNSRAFGTPGSRFHSYYPRRSGRLDRDLNVICNLSSWCQCSTGLSLRWPSSYVVVRRLNCLRAGDNIL